MAGHAARSSRTVILSAPGALSWHDVAAHLAFSSITSIIHDRLSVSGSAAVGSVLTSMSFSLVNLASSMSRSRVARRRESDSKPFAVLRGAVFPCCRDFAHRAIRYISASVLASENFRRQYWRLAVLTARRISYLLASSPTVLYNTLASRHSSVHHGADCPG